MRKHATWMSNRLPKKQSILCFILFILAKTGKPANSNLHEFELHRPSSKGTKLLLQIIKAIINHVKKLSPNSSSMALRKRKNEHLNEPSKYHFIFSEFFFSHCRCRSFARALSLFLLQFLVLSLSYTNMC